MNAENPIHIKQVRFLNEVLAQADLSMSDLSRLLNWSTARLSTYLVGRSALRYDHIATICKVTKLPRKKSEELLIDFLL